MSGVAAVIAMIALHRGQIRHREGLGRPLAVILAITTVAHLLGDGRSTWFEGTMLFAVYVILVLAFHLLP